MRDWRSIETAPENQLVHTRIKDASGERNMATLRKRDNLWWTPDGMMYVYYRPTHWAPLTAGE